MQQLLCVCSATTEEPVLDEQGDPMLDQDGTPITRTVPAPPLLVDLTPEEEAVHQASRDEAAAVDAAQEARVAQQAIDRAAVQAYAASHPDPHWQALARLLGT